MTHRDTKTGENVHLPHMHKHTYTHSHTQKYKTDYRYLSLKLKCFQSDNVDVVADTSLNTSE